MNERMDRIIKQFLVSEERMAPSAAEDFVKDLRRHEDIYDEFINFIETGQHVSGVKCADLTAKELAERLPHLHGYVIYEFLVGLRDNHEEYLNYLKDGVSFR